MAVTHNSLACIVDVSLLDFGQQVIRFSEQDLEISARRGPLDKAF
jgi:hypothetical protein